MKYLLRRSKFFLCFYVLIGFSIKAQSYKYCGIWLGYGYQCFTVQNSGNTNFYNVGYEVLLITSVDSIHVSALKIIGDSCVPKNKVSWQANVVDGMGFITLGNPTSPASGQLPTQITFDDSNHINKNDYIHFVRATCGEIDSLSINIDSIYQAHHVSCTYSCPPQTIVVPNIFTPNGDGINDDFFISNKGVSNNFEIEIYNRWGEKVFHSSEVDFKWNGKKTMHLYLMVLISI